MLNRRSFLVGAGAGFIAPRMLNTLSRHLRLHGEALILAPKNPINTIHVSLRNDLEMCLERLDTMTWRDFLTWIDTDARILKRWASPEIQLDEEISREAYIAYSLRDTIAQRTADLLKSCGLGSLFDQPDRVGGIRFEHPRKMGCGHFAWANARHLHSCSEKKQPRNTVGD